MISAAIPQFGSSAARLSYWAVLLLRCLFFSALIFGINRLIDLGTHPLLVSLGAIAGVIVVSPLAFSRLTSRGFLTGLVAAYCIYALLVLPLRLLPHLDFVRTFWGFDLTMHLNLILGAGAIAGLSTWAFWRYRHALTFEVLILATIAIYFFSGHRNFHFDTPRIVHNIAWAMRAEQLSTLIGLGTLMVLSLLTYMFFATLPGKPERLPGAAEVRANRSHPNVAFAALLLLLLSSVLYLITTQLYSYYNKAAATRAANGVGDATNEGMSPLGFHSALGSTNQPAALVRLEGDYKENPFLPMLYLRESALSDFNGRELTLANRTFDQDVSITTPDESYSAEPDTRLLSRTPLVQSVYLLTEHKLAFAVDYPTSIVKLKNPNPSRFKAAFRAYSMAPGFSLESVANSDVGDPAWSAATRAHYLEPHEDSRYAELAAQITTGVSRPVEQAAALVQYLNKNAIYTLTPNHEVKPDEDPVAPFLFGDKRGYCVHFAHATVYMLRSLGIPARIGTGYLTDLSQSRDGHILLRMSDRHAWAEVYIAGHGWIPFDTQPEQVENHADTQVDAKVLEELMGLLGPGEEILPKDVTANEPGAQEPQPLPMPDARDAMVLLIALVLALTLAKMYLRFGWMLPGGPAFKLRRSYVALLSSLHDLGYRREYGETRSEFAIRVGRELGFTGFSLALAHQELAYAVDGERRFEAQEIDAIRGDDFERLSRLSWWRKALAAVNPSSILAAVSGGRW